MPTRCPGCAPAQLDDALRRVGDQLLGRRRACASARPSHPTSARSGAPSRDRARARGSAPSAGARRPGARSGPTASARRARRAPARARRRRRCARPCSRGRARRGARACPSSACRAPRARSCARRESIISIASTGYAPIAVSCESITASVPSRIALATSVTSARVGRDERTIESSICVAVIEIRARSPASRSRRFCTIGTSWIGSSIPRSPRATITPSLTRDDVLGALDGLRLLDLGDQRHARVLAHAEDVLGTPHEAQRDHVDADPDARPAGARDRPRAPTEAGLRVPGC